MKNKDTIISIRCNREDRDIFYSYLYAIKAMSLNADSTNNIKIIIKSLENYKNILEGKNND